MEAWRAKSGLTDRYKPGILAQKILAVSFPMILDLGPEVLARIM